MGGHCVRERLDSVLVVDRRAERRMCVGRVLAEQWQATMVQEHARRCVAYVSGMPTKSMCMRVCSRDSVNGVPCVGMCM